MKITALETLCLSRMHEPERQWITSRYRTIKADCAIVLIHTDEGITGIGEASAYGWLAKIRSWVEWLAPTLVGKDPLDPAIAPRPTGRDRSIDTAIAGIDCALWDLRGKAAGKRVSELLAPDPAHRVRLYASGGCRYDWRYNPEQLIEEALGYIEQGYTAMKFRIGTEWSFDGVTVDRFLGHVRELAQAVDGRMDLALDGNCRLTEEEAMPIAREIERLGFAWFEEPIDRNNIAGNARLCAAVEMPITGGEAFSSLDEFRPYIEQKAYDVLQPDAGLSGITETVRIAEMAAHYGLPVYPHSWHNGLMCMAHSHLVAAIPTIKIVELCQHQGPLQWGILAEKPQIEDGHLILPNRPGLGVELAEDVSVLFPHVEGHYGINVER